jgi:hypothetical protein
VLHLDRCVYASDQKEALPLPSPPHSSVSSPSIATSLSTRSPSAKVTSPSTPALFQADFPVRSKDVPFQLSDSDLYHHYLQHTSRTLNPCQSDQSMFQIGMPTLALQSKTVFHSLIALSAVHLCCDMISKEPPPDPSIISQIMTTAYQNYNLASERMRDLMSRPGPIKPDPLLASTILLVPVAAASQQVNHWISCSGGTINWNNLLLTSPRDITVIMRGVRSILVALRSDDTAVSNGICHEPEFATDSTIWLQEINVSPPIPVRAHSHVMFPILTATIQGAFSKLQERLSSAHICLSGTSYEIPDLDRSSVDSFSACSDAFDYLKHLGTSTFSQSNVTASASPDSTVREPLDSDGVSLPQVVGWLRSYATRLPSPSPTNSLTRYFLTFLVQVPQAYLDLVLPLLDQRQEYPSGEAPADLTKEQALALDIYAHWSVLMFLVEDESWWIGQLPVVTLTGMLNKYGDDFVFKLWPELSRGNEKWWPGSMLTILKEIKRC